MSTYGLQVILEKAFETKVLKLSSFCFGAGLKLSSTLVGHWVSAKRDKAWMGPLPPLHRSLKSLWTSFLRITFSPDLVLAPEVWLNFLGVKTIFHGKDLTNRGNGKMRRSRFSGTSFQCTAALSFSWESTLFVASPTVHSQCTKTSPENVTYTWTHHDSLPVWSQSKHFASMIISKMGTKTLGSQSYPEVWRS